MIISTQYNTLYFHTTIITPCYLLMTDNTLHTKHIKRNYQIKLAMIVMIPEHNRYEEKIIASTNCWFCVINIYIMSYFNTDKMI